jgi:hypothetical protein
MTAQNRCRRSNGTLRAWFATREEAVAFAENQMNTTYQGDVPVHCLKPGCGGWHLSQPHWPDARAAAKAWVTRGNFRSAPAVWTIKDSKPTLAASIANAL